MLAMNKDGDAGGMRNSAKAEVVVRQNSQVAESTLDANV